MKTGWVIAFSIVCAFLAAGILYLAASPPRGEAITLLPPPTRPPLVVYVSGAVNHAGLCSLPPGSRVRDALEAAGGLSVDAEPASLNLAAYVEDGQRIDVPARQPTRPAAQASASTPAPGQAAQPTRKAQPTQSTPPPASTGRININTATQAELESLPGIGPSLAQRILDYREQNGPFKTIEDIQNVKGIGPVTFERIKDLITVGD